VNEGCSGSLLVASGNCRDLPNVALPYLGCDLCDLFISAAYNTQDAGIIDNTKSHAIQAILHSCRGGEIVS
jgi:hypothetical protein